MHLRTGKPLHTANQPQMQTDLLSGNDTTSVAHTRPGQEQEQEIPLASVQWDKTFLFARTTQFLARTCSCPVKHSPIRHCHRYDSCLLTHCSVTRAPNTWSSPHVPAAAVELQPLVPRNQTSAQMAPSKYYRKGVIPMCRRVLRLRLR